MGPQKIILYRLSNGKEPFSEWFLNLDQTTRAIVTARLKRVNLGCFGDCKLLKQASGVWELRIDYGSGYRIYFGKHNQTVVILLLGGDKGSQNSDIVRAKRYWNNYKELLK